MGKHVTTATVREALRVADTIRGARSFHPARATVVRVTGVGAVARSEGPAG
jgi:hypothetical protein